MFNAITRKMDDLYFVTATALFERPEIFRTGLLLFHLFQRLSFHYLFPFDFIYEMTKIIRFFHNLIDLSPEMPAQFRNKFI